MQDDVEATEGSITVRVPGISGKERGPGTHQNGVFYNPAMALNRDVSVLALHALHQPGWHVLEGLAASGVRGLRYAKSVPDVHVTLNDWNPQAAERITANAQANGVDVNVTRRNLGALLWETAYNWIDIDPFGSPAPFTDAATRALRNRGVLALTATDSGALAGTYPRVARRRYLATPLRSDIGHEIGLRILIGHAVRQAAKFDRALTPVVAHATDYYYRCFLQNRQGRQRADQAIKRTGYAWYCRPCGDRGLHRDRHDTCPACSEPADVAGPLWLGPLGDPDTLQAMREAADHVPLGRPDDTLRLLDLLIEEADAPGLFYNLHEEVSRANLDRVPRRDATLQALRDAGHQATRTHFDPVGIRTDAPVRELHRILHQVVPR